MSKEIILLLCHGGGFLAFLWSKNGLLVKTFGGPREVKVQKPGSKIPGAGSKITGAGSKKAGTREVKFQIIN